MNRKIYWGLGVLILLFAGFMVYVQIDYTIFKKDLEKDHPKTDVVSDVGSEKVAIDDPSPPIENQPVQITEASNQNSQQKSEPIRKTFSVEGEVEFSQLPKLPADIDPDDIPPFYRMASNGIKWHYNRPLSAEEREMYYTLKTDESWGGNPAKLKATAINLVKRKISDDVVISIANDAAAGNITFQEARRQIDEFREITR